MRMLSQRRGIHGTRGAPSTADTHRRQARSPARSRRARCLLCAAFSATAGVPSAPVLPRPLWTAEELAALRTSQHATSHLARLVQHGRVAGGKPRRLTSRCAGEMHRVVAACHGRGRCNRAQQAFATTQPVRLPIRCNSASPVATALSRFVRRRNQLCCQSAATALSATTQRCYI